MRRLFLAAVSICTALAFTCCTSESDESSFNELADKTEIQTEIETTVSETKATAISETKSDTTETAQWSAKNAYVEIPEDALSQEESAELLIAKLENHDCFDRNKQHIAYEGTKVIYYRECYAFRTYDDFDDHRTTTGWYAVNPSDGQCFDTVTENMPLYYNFNVTESGVEVYEKFADEPMQILDLDIELLLSSDSVNPRIVVNDLDFDNYDDLAVPVRLGASNAVYQYYRFDPETKMFEDWAELNELYFYGSPDVKNKTLSFHSKGGAVDSCDYVYKWQDKKLVMIAQDKRYQHADEIYTDHYEYDEQGNEILVKREKYILDENNNIIGTEEVEIE